MSEKEAQAGRSVNYELCYEPDENFFYINGVRYVPEAALSSLREELEKVRAERDRYKEALSEVSAHGSAYGRDVATRALAGEAKREGERE